MKKVFFILSILLINIVLYAKNTDTVKVEPPNWWVGMQNNELQLLVYYKDIALTEVKIQSDLVELKAVNKVENQNYLFLDLVINENAGTGSFDINFYTGKKITAKYTYELKAKTSQVRGFSNADIIYLLMPDRFANGDISNDNNTETLEKANRKNPDGRHGGDINGIIDHLDYIKELGITALWMNPFLENDMPKYSYHGYAITDFYKSDPRIGTNDEFIEFTNECHSRDLKVIMDMVFNHCGSYHWWMNDLPEKSWLNNDSSCLTNFRGETVIDPYVSEYDYNTMVSGWFVPIMPDLNQHNKYLANYLIQNTLWWIETGNLDGIRMDTQPYSYKDFMTILAQRIHLEYPDLTLLGETWLQTVPMVAYFQENSPVSGDYNSGLNCTTDFPLYYAIKDGLNEEESWTGGIFKYFYILSQDFLYNDAMKSVIFVDNHDIDRFYSSVGENFDKYKMAIGFLLTTRGIPSVYYGTEILMTGWAGDGHGHIREDFPGGWAEDKVDAFSKEGRTDQQNEAFDYMKKIANWRKTNDAILNGKLVHFIPENNVYVYFRYTENEAVMVLMNNSNTDSRTVDCSRFSEILDGYASGIEINTDNVFDKLDKIEIDKKSIMIIELVE
jgi:glycosidase